MAIRVVLADDHPVVRQAICALLEGEGDCKVVGEAGNGREAIEMAEQLRPDAVILDISMPVMGGMDAAREIHEILPDLPTILLTVHTEESFVLEALEAGVRGYVVKMQTGLELVQAIKDVVRGLLYVSPRISRALVDAFLAKTVPARTTLTARERQVLQLTAEGKTSRQIANVLGFSARTVDSHRARIMYKLDINDRSSLVRYALRQGLVQP